MFHRAELQGASLRGKVEQSTEKRAWWKHIHVGGVYGCRGVSPLSQWTEYPRPPSISPKVGMNQK
jgi:hypothetical protein